MQQILEKSTSAMPLTMEAYRTEMFRARVAARLHEGKAAGLSPEAIIATIAAEQRALAATITDSAFVAVAGDALVKAQATVNPNPRYQSTPAQAHESMQQIMKRRAAEANQFAALLETGDYVASLAGITPEQAQAAVPALRDVKMADTLNDLLHLENGAPQVIAHIDAAAKGAMLEHDALALVFAADGALHDAMMTDIAAHLPNANRDDVHRVAAQWLGDREAAAKLTSELSSNEGAAYIEAVRQSTEYHRASHEAPTVASPASAIVPTTTVQASSTSPSKSQREHEKEKTATQRAEDVAYTINHAVSCGTTDLILQPVIAAAFGGAVNVGCAANKTPENLTWKETFSRFSLKNLKNLSWKKFRHDAGHYLKGEIIGDFVAVPLTIGVQRLFPNFMNGLRTLTEPLFGWAFRGGANRTARHWASEHGVAEDAPETKAHAAEIYEHEISHLPQAVVWNMFAYPIGAAAQKLDGHNHSWGQIFKSKLVGAVISNGLLIGGRMLAPGAAQKWDALTGDNIFAPVNKAVGKLFGVDEKAMEKAAHKQRGPSGSKAWAARLEETAEADKSVNAIIQ